MSAMPLRFEGTLIAADAVPLSPALAQTVDRLHNRPPTEVAEQVHPGVFGVFVGFFVAMFGVYAITFRSEKEALFSVVVSTVYAVVYFAVPFVVWRVATAHGLPANTQSFIGFLRSDLAIATGRIKGWEAAIQIWSIPAALTLATAGIAAASVIAG